jgi:hypothetical protein
MAHILLEDRIEYLNIQRASVGYICPSVTADERRETLSGSDRVLEFAGINDVIINLVLMMVGRSQGERRLCCWHAN